MEEEYMTAADVARYLGVDRKTVYTNLRDREKTGFPEPHRRIGRTPVWREEDLREWREAHPGRRRKKVDVNPPDEPEA
ncbi:helix-turn-helix transcriptional regulator [Polymorphospora lycopeni]|uniref:Helix-turn-helix domain-containing protein n=1 Tax=Polymorphospora lycopeni TaxID=3140240 RepID=A0ABV5CNG4_9ACTN